MTNTLTKFDAEVLRIVTKRYGSTPAGLTNYRGSSALVEKVEQALARLQERGLVELRTHDIGRRWHATQKQVEQVKLDPNSCPKCGGTGQVPHRPDAGRCWSCGGTGRK